MRTFLQRLTNPENTMQYTLKEKTVSDKTYNDLLTAARIIFGTTQKSYLLYKLRSAYVRVVNAFPPSDLDAPVLTIEQMNQITDLTEKLI